MPSNFGERGAAIPGVSKLISVHPHDEEKDYALKYMNSYQLSKTRNKGVAASQSLDNMKSRPLEIIKEEANIIAVKDEEKKSFHLP